MMSLAPRSQASEVGARPDAASTPVRNWILRIGGLATILAVCVALFAPGPLSVDEVTYLLSMRSLAMGNGIEIWNGFEELASPELAPAWIKVVNGRLVSQYPDFFALGVLPFYQLFGFKGLFLANTLAFLGVVTLTWSLAKNHFGVAVARLSLALLLGSTFAVEYAVSAWPHMISALCVLSVLVLLDPSQTESSPRVRTAKAFLAGLIGGYGLGVRFDVAFGLAGISCALLLIRPPRWREVASMCVGLVPGLLGLALLNAAKFGQFTPFTYGPKYYGPGSSSVRSSTDWVWLTIFALLATLLSLGSTRLRPAMASKNGVRWAIAMIVAMSALFVPQTRSALRDLSKGSAELVVDMRARDIDRVDPASMRTSKGAVVYFGSLKKAFLQSCPWLPLAWLGLRQGRKTQNHRLLAVLLSVPVAFVLPYSFFAWDGGLALNQRYFIPALPMLAILGGLGLANLSPSFGTKLTHSVAGVGVAALLLYAALQWLERTRVSTEGLLLTMPLVLSGALVLAIGLGRHRFASAMAIWSCGMAAVSCLGYDLPRTLEFRSFHARIGAAATRAINEDALIFSEPAELAATAVNGAARIRLANPSKDAYRSFRELIDFHLSRGHTVLLALDRRRLDQLQKSDLLLGLDLRIVESYREMLVATLAYKAVPRHNGTNANLVPR